MPEEAAALKPQLTTDWPTLLYVGLITTIAGLLTIQSIPLQYIEKDGLHMTASQISRLGLIVGIPAYIAFLAGTLRDRWKPFRQGDRGYFIIFGPLAGAAAYYIGHGQMTQLKLAVGLIAAGIFMQLVLAAFHGLSSEISKRAGLAGSISTAFNVFSAAVAAVGILIGGFIRVHLSTTEIFNIVALLSCCFAFFGIWQPNLIKYSEQQDARAGSHLWADVKQLAISKPLWLAVLINFMWNFAPGSNTALLFFLTSDHVHLNSGQYGTFRAVTAVAFVPTMLLYGYLCRKYSLRKLIWFFAFIGIPQLAFMPYIHSFAFSIVIAIFIGITGGGLTAAIWDLTLRVAPKGMEGTAMLLVVAGNALVGNEGDYIGSRLYSEGGFVYCAIAITAVYALIVPVLPFIPRSVTDEKEFEPIELVA
jgi:MFS family permease